MNAELEKLVEQITDQIVARLSASRGDDLNGADCAECSIPPLIRRRCGSPLMR